MGGIYDDRFLVKPTNSAMALMPDANRELPYEGAKEMLLVDDVDNKEYLKELLEAMFPELLPSAKKKKVTWQILLQVSESSAVSHCCSFMHFHRFFMFCI